MVHLKPFLQDLNNLKLTIMKYLQRFKLNVISIIVAFTLFQNFNVLAQKVDYKEVEKVAINAYSLNSSQTKSNYKIKQVIPISDNDEIAYYIFNFEPKGHIVVSNDKSFEPILGYGLNSTIDFDSIPPGMKYLLDNFKVEIGLSRKHGVVSNKENSDKWDYYINKVESSGQKSYSTGTYLLQTIWGQDLGYNRFCPLDPNTNNRTIVGCGGVALAQILYYWQCRVFPDNSISYTPTGFPGPISLNFYGQNYNWSGMSKTAPDDNNAIILYHSAASIKSNFTQSETTSDPTNVHTALVSYFGFNASNVQYKAGFTNDTWINTLKAEINAERPIFYAGYNLTTTPYYGHAWVIDGYNSSNQFHCNWGWHRQNNSSDWYLLSALNVDGYNFNDGQSAILNIYPLLDACSGLNGATTICSSNTSYSVTIPLSASVTWSKSSNLTQVGSNTTSAFTVYAISTSPGGSGQITASIKNSQGQVFLTRAIPVWVGIPSKPNSNLIYTESPVCKNRTTYCDFTDDPIVCGVTGYTWNWSGAGLLYSSGQGTPNITMSTSSAFNGGNVRIKVTNACGTSAYSNNSFIALDPDCGDGLYIVYPNPVNEILTIDPSNDPELLASSTTPAEIQIVELIDKMGLVVYRNNPGKGITTSTVRVSNLPNGFYALRIFDGQQWYTQKVIIQH